MERLLGNLRAWLRETAYRAGLPRFWRWWTAELAPLMPAAPRSAIQRRRMRPILEFGDGEVVLWRPEISDGAFRLARAATIPLAGDSAATAAAGRAALAALGPAGHAAMHAPRVVVALPLRQVLRKELVLPVAVEQNLRQTLSYDLDRHTPFRPDQVYFDAVVTGRDATKKTIRVDWTAALKTVVDSARRQVEAWGASVVAVLPGPVSAALPRLNLLPYETRPARVIWRRWQVWAPMALVAVLAIAAVMVPLVQKREYAIELQRQTEVARVQAEAASAIRREFERLEGDFNYPLARKYAYPATVQVLDDVTRLLPDDTWLTQLEMKTTTKGKDTQRELFLRGESANGGKLIGLLEDSKLVEQAALRSSTTKLQPGPGEVFDLGAQLKPTAAPAIVAPPTAANDAPPASTAPAAGAPPPGPPQATSGPTSAPGSAGTATPPSNSAGAVAPAASPATANAPVPTAPNPTVAPAAPATPAAPAPASNASTAPAPAAPAPSPSGVPAPAPRTGIPVFAPAPAPGRTVLSPE
jgi:general secretion pathway protein L